MRTLEARISALETVRKSVRRGDCLRCGLEDLERSRDGLSPLSRNDACPHDHDGPEVTLAQALAELNEIERQQRVAADSRTGE
ncbi:MAG: hypothetical protein AMXMBFR78_14770 [Rubrivivax sp.]|jgi:hypothetical protein